MNMEIDRYLVPESSLVEPLKTPQTGIPETSDMGGVSILMEDSSALTQETPTGILDGVVAEPVSPVDGYAYKAPINEAPESDNINRIKSWLKKQRVKLACGAFALSAGLTLASDPLEETKKEVVEAAPWVGGGIVAAEAMWIGGAAMMVASVGDKIGNPLKLKSRLPEVAKKANSSNLFLAGFWTNTIGAVGDFVVLSSGVMYKLPVRSWGVLGFTLMDLGLTFAIRKTIWDKVATAEINQTPSPIINMVDEAQ